MQADDEGRAGMPATTWPRRIGAIALLAGIGFLVLVVTLQFLRGDLDWVAAQLSLYLHGRYGLLLRTAYCVLALAMAALALAVQASQPRWRRRAVVPALFCCSALGLAMVAIGDSYLPEYAPLIALPVHLLSAQSAFLCGIAAVLLQSWYFRGDPRWQALHRSAFALALVAFVVLAINVGIRSAPRGLSQKAAIVLIVGWLVLVARHLAWLRPMDAAVTSGSRDNALFIQPEDA